MFGIKWIYYKYCEFIRVICQSFYTWSRRYLDATVRIGGSEEKEEEITISSFSSLPPMRICNACTSNSSFRFQNARNKLIHTVHEIFDLSPRKRRLQLPENLLLAPISVGVTRSEDKDIKAALFQFISATEVKL